MKSRIGYNILGVLAVGLALSACAGSGSDWDATGAFEATEVTVSAEGSGNLVRFEVQEGDTVQRGLVIGVIDTLQLELKRQQLVSSRSAAVNRKQDIVKQVAATEQQIAYQRSELVRYRRLLDRDAATLKQVDDIENQLSVLEKQLSAQLSQLERANSSVSDEAQALEIQIAQVEDQILKCRVKSPISGTVLVKYAEQGEFAQTGQPLFAVADMGNIYLRAYIVAEQLTQMKLGQKVKVYSDLGADGQREYDGRVEWISSRAEFTPKTIQTRSERANLVYAVKIAVRNDGFLKIGMYGQVKL